MNAPCGYSLPHYRDILRTAKARYWLPRVQDVAFGLPERDFFLVRHDVDLTPWAALRMAELEHAEGVCTTYYFRLHAPFYNGLDAAVIEVVRAIADLGHEVGLHYEPGHFLALGQDPVEGTRRDIATFEAATGLRTRTIAQHQPAQGPLLEAIDPDRPCAYQAELVRAIPYFGDSGHHWREGCICTKLGVHRQLHTLIHPHAWVYPDRPWQELLRAHAADLGARITAEMERYIAGVERYLARRAELDRAREARYRTPPTV